MNFEFSEDQRLLKEQVAKLLDAQCTSAEVRKVLESDAPYHKTVWRALCDLGLPGTAIPEIYGGAGASYLELCVVAEELGRAIAPVPFSSSVYLAAEALLLAGSEEQKRKYLPRLAGGEAIGTLAVDEENGVFSQAGLTAAARGGTLTGQKRPVADGSVADIAIVAARTGGEGAREISLFIVELSHPSVTRETLATIDPTRDFAGLSFSATPAEPLGPTGGGWDLLMRVYDRAAILFAFEQLGGADKALQTAVDYAKERYAFGRPIGSFQAVKHMLTDMYVAAELARSNCYYGAWALATDAVELPVAAATARVSATKAYQQCARNNAQTHGGMGFTWEMDCHLHFRRANLLAVNLGGLTWWQDALIDRIEQSNMA